jgi:hypothetical protein
MTGLVAHRRLVVEGARSSSATALTEVELIWIEKSIEYWVRFGNPVQERIIDRRRRVLGFCPESFFAFVRWTANDYGTVASHLDILRAVAPHEAYQTVPAVTPGGELLLTVSGWPKVERVLQLIDAIDASGIDGADVAPDHWRHVHNRLAAGESPRAYTRAQHCAWIKRRSILP